MATSTLESYKMTTGYYDEGAIMQAAGVSERNARFAHIFGDAQGTPDLGTDYNVLLSEARRLNTEMFAAAEQAKQDEARVLLAQPEPWSRETWKTLKRLGFALYSSDEYGGWEAALNEYGQRLIDPMYRSNAYADQTGIDG